ncbi:cupin 2 domain-containing protein [Apiospora phragmitis]|uniref:Cupin 2 domain-containing protein n=1 Tax=Apiospora phragmitis TaxID=2905665 RepID=A0ABR1T918_9PEZI
MTQPTNPRLVITGHAADGTSIFRTDEAVETFYPFGPSVSSFATFDTRDTVPVSNNGDLTTAAATPPKLPRCPPGGTLFCVTNLPPRYTVPMHRTQSMDYCVVMSGEIVLALDGGEEKVVKAGEFIIQGGANHQWINRTDEPCRISFVMVGADKVKLEDGTVLEETLFKGPKSGSS